MVGLWGWVLLWSTLSGRLDLLLNAAFHPVVGIAGVVLLVLAVLQLRWAIKQRNVMASRGWLFSGLVAVAILVVPPAPSFSDLAASRPDSLPEAPQLSFSCRLNSER